jgi:predicted ATPase
MKIKSLYFKNSYLGWEVDHIEFQNLNLLVGLSGAGKSQIINALWQLRGIALGKLMNNVEWAIAFSIDSQEYEWKGSFVAASFDANYKIKTESIQVISTNTSIERRHDGLIRIENSLSPPLTTTRSTTPEGLLFQIYSNYDFIETIVSHFKMMNLRDHTQSQSNVLTDFYTLRFRYASISRRISPNFNLNELINSNYNIAERLLIAYKKQTDELTVYKDILEEVQSIFPAIEEWAIEEQTNKNTEGGHIEYKIKINGQRRFIPHWNIASGMLRTFNIIADLYLSNRETVFLLDEFENSLGHNCLPDLEELIIDHSAESQFIITSHHPDIINKIPKENWIIIERTNGAIHNRHADSLPFINSAHEHYLILINHFDRQ